MYSTTTQLVDKLGPRIAQKGEESINAATENLLEEYNLAFGQSAETSHPRGADVNNEGYGGQSRVWGCNNRDCHKTNLGKSNCLSSRYKRSHDEARGKICC